MEAINVDSAHLLSRKFSEELEPEEIYKTITIENDELILRTEKSVDRTEKPEV